MEILRSLVSAHARYMGQFQTMNISKDYSVELNLIFQRIVTPYS